MRVSASVRVVTWLAVPLWLAGCGLHGPCDHTRGITRYATADGGDVEPVSQVTALSSVSFWEHQRDGFRRQVTWNVLSRPLRGSPVQVALREGSAAAGGGMLLYTFPIENAYALSDTLIQVTSGMVEGFGEGEPGAWYRGTIPFLDLMLRMYQGQTYLEVQTDSFPAGEIRARLGTPRIFPPPDDPSPWQAVFCS
jgi:hypothetical protein